jgi:hypothetical protein
MSIKKNQQQILYTFEIKLLKFSLSISSLILLLRRQTGCFCNPGACQYNLGLSDEQIIRNHKEFGHVCWDQHDLIEGLPTGAVRVSIPYCCTFEDIEVSILDSLLIMISQC